MSERLCLTIPGRPVPLQRSRTSSGRHYLPVRSRMYRDAVQATWMAAGHPTVDAAPFASSMRFYGARVNADLDNLIKAVLDALNGLAFSDDKQLACLSGCHKLPVDGEGMRAVVEIWPVEAAGLVSTPEETQ